MHTVSGANIHFPKPTQCSVRFEAIAVPDETPQDQEVGMFSFFTLHQLATLGRTQPAFELAQALASIPTLMPQIVCPNGSEPIELVPYAPARRTFEARLQFNSTGIHFNVANHGFGFFSVPQLPTPRFR